MDYQNALNQLNQTAAAASGNLYATPGAQSYNRNHLGGISGATVGLQGQARATVDQILDEALKLAGEIRDSSRSLSERIGGDPANYAEPVKDQEMSIAGRLSTLRNILASAHVALNRAGSALG